VPGLTDGRLWRSWYLSWRGRSANALVSGDLSVLVPGRKRSRTSDSDARDARFPGPVMRRLQAQTHREPLVGVVFQSALQHQASTQLKDTHEFAHPTGAASAPNGGCRDAHSWPPRQRPRLGTTPGSTCGPTASPSCRGGEWFAEGAEHTLTTILHEAAHALADVRQVQDTSRQGKYHNRRFVQLAAELGLAWPSGAKAHPVRASARCG
jgi:hypothetical protein